MIVFCASGGQTAVLEFLPVVWIGKAVLRSLAKEWGRWKTQSPSRGSTRSLYAWLVLGESFSGTSDFICSPSCNWDHALITASCLLLFIVNFWEEQVPEPSELSASGWESWLSSYWLNFLSPMGHLSLPGVSCSFLNCVSDIGPRRRVAANRKCPIFSQLAHVRCLQFDQIWLELIWGRSLALVIY